MDAEDKKNLSEFLFEYLRKKIAPPPIARGHDGRMFEVGKHEQNIPIEEELNVMLRICHEEGIDAVYVWNRERFKDMGGV